MKEVVEEILTHPDCTAILINMAIANMLNGWITDAHLHDISWPTKIYGKSIIVSERYTKPQAWKEVCLHCGVYQKYIEHKVCACCGAPMRLPNAAQ